MHVLVVGITILLTTVGVAVAAQYPPKASTCASAPSAGTPGIDVIVKGTNWSPNTTVSLSFHQNGSVAGLGTAATDEKGKFKTGTSIPGSADRGKASIEVDGMGASGQNLACFTNFQVINPHKSVAIIPASGTPITPGMLLAAFGFIFALVLIHRRRNRALAMLDYEADLKSSGDG